MTQDNKDLLENRIPLGLLEPDIFEKTYEAVGEQEEYDFKDEYEEIAADNVMLEERVEELEAKLAKAVDTLEWYAEQARLCRLIHSGGDSGRHALQEDGGNKARTTLAELKGGKDA